MDSEKLNKLPCTDIGIMLGDISNLDWMDFEKLEDDITVGRTIDKRNAIFSCKVRIRTK